MLGPYQKNWLCHPLPLFMAVSMITNTWYVTLELLLHAAFVADEIWGDMLEPAGTVLVSPIRWFVSWFVVIGRTQKSSVLVCFVSVYSGRRS